VDSGLTLQVYCIIGQEPPLKNQMGLDYGLQLFENMYRPYLYVLLVGSGLLSVLTVPFAPK